MRVLVVDDAPIIELGLSDREDLKLKLTHFFKKRRPKTRSRNDTGFRPNQFGPRVLLDGLRLRAGPLSGYSQSARFPAAAQLYAAPRESS